MISNEITGKIGGIFKQKQKDGLLAPEKNDLLQNQLPTKISNK